MSSFGATVLSCSVKCGENVVKFLINSTNEVICSTRTFPEKVIFVSVEVCSMCH